MSDIIAFIGVGNMGNPMATNLHKAGYKIKVFDISTEMLIKAKENGLETVNNINELITEKVSIVITMLPEGKHSKEIYLGEDGIINKVSKNCLLIDCSTIDIDTSKEIGKAAEDKEILMIDAPVSGGVMGAQKATLNIMVGGSVKAFEKAHPILKIMGKNIYHAGKVGSGNGAKICNNMLLAVLMAGTSEALTMATKNGIDPKVMSDIMLQSSGCNWTLEKYNPCPDVMENVPSSNQYEGGFMVKLMNKDLNLAMNTAADSVSTTPMATAAQSLYRMLESQGHGEKDFSSVYTLFNKHTNT